MDEYGNVDKSPKGTYLIYDTKLGEEAMVEMAAFNQKYVDPMLKAYSNGCSKGVTQ